MFLIASKEPRLPVKRSIHTAFLLTFSSAAGRDEAEVLDVLVLLLLQAVPLRRAVSASRPPAHLFTRRPLAG